MNNVTYSATTSLQGLAFRISGARAGSTSCIQDRDNFASVSVSDSDCGLVNLLMGRLQRFYHQNTRPSFWLTSLSSDLILRLLKHEGDYH
jgi:hypothetical protein